MSGAAPSVLDQIHERMRAKYPIFSEILRRDRELFGKDWVREVEDGFARVFGADASARWDEALRGYVEFSLDAMREQKHFEKHGRYRYGRLSEIKSRFYENEQHMLGNYLTGMVLSHYFWPHHYRLLCFFRQEVLQNRSVKTGRFFDVGTGTGFYSLQTLLGWPQIRGTGFDISEFSIRFTRNLLRSFGVENRYETVRCNVFEADLPWGTADFVVSQEVLEHLEDPAAFCRILLRLARGRGLAYITAAITAGHTDHIYLFRSPDEVAAMLTEAGWTIEASRVEWAYEGQPVEVTPCVVGFVCRKP